MKISTGTLDGLRVIDCRHGGYLYRLGIFTGGWLWDFTWRDLFLSEEWFCRYNGINQQWIRVGPVGVGRQDLTAWDPDI